jgi:type IV fimbrial biogenesis protein FimT
MQVLSRPRNVSLIVVRKSAEQARVVAGRRDSGFTLVELLVALAVAAILMIVAVPSFQNITLSNRLTTTVNDIVGAISTARMEAIKLNASTQLCSDSATSNTTGTTDALGNACGTQTGAVYALIGTTSTQIRAGTVGIATPLQLSGNLKALRFSAAGLAQTVGTTTPYSGQIVDICTNAMSSNNHRVIQMTTGSIMATTTKSGACP